MTEIGRQRRDPGLDVLTGAIPASRVRTAKVWRRSWSRGGRGASTPIRPLSHSSPEHLLDDRVDQLGAGHGDEEASVAGVGPELVAESA